jgi:hypothetical protein
MASITGTTGGRSTHHRARLACAALVALASALPLPAEAWKPFTHNTSAFEAYADAIDDGNLTIGGVTVPVRPEVVAALTAWPQFYNAGVVGPDGFPDVTFGQAVIHPEINGEWLQHILSEAWAAQSGPTYTADEKAQILAFAYGFLTHGAGDLWAHSTVNDFTHGVFPAIAQMLSSTDDASIGIRHFLVEGYIGDATPNFDNNPDRTDVGGGDWSSDSTPGVPFAVPKEFVYRTLVDPDAATPLPNRGPLIDFFVSLQEDLEAERDSLPGDLETLAGAISLYDSAVQTLNDANVTLSNASQTLGLAEQVEAAVDDAKARFQANCDIVCVETVFGTCVLYWVDDTIECGSAVIDLQDLADDFSVSIPDMPLASPSLSTLSAWFNSVVATATYMLNQAIAAVTQATQAVASATADVAAATQAVGDNRTLVYKAYLDEWSKDIDSGLMEWPDGMGLQFTEGMFNAQAKRDHQNSECVLQCDPGQGGLGQESAVCAACEDAIGMVDTTLARLAPFRETHIMSMLGAPDLLLAVQGILGSLSGQLQALLDAQTTPILNPILETEAEIRAFFDAWYLSVIQAVFGVDLVALEEFTKDMNRYMCLDEEEFTLPQLGTVTIPLFPGGEHGRMDALLELPDPHHMIQPPLPDHCGELLDDADFAFLDVPPLHNTVMLAKLLLLDGSGLNQLLGGLLGRQIATYSDAAVPANVMVQAMFDSVVTVQGVPHTVDTWLRTIDGDHQWRADGRPRFCDIEDPSCCASPSDPFCAAGEDQDPACGIGGQPCPRTQALNGGNGSFPLFESCVLRPAFRAVFVDWENGLDNFPDHGDVPSPDPANDPQAPASSLVPSGAVYQGASLFVGASHTIQQDAADAPAGQAFATASLHAQRRVYPSGGSPGPFVDVAVGSTFSLSGADGGYVVEHRAGDPCHTLDGTVGTPGATQSTTVVLDTTPAALQCNFGGPYDSDDLAPVSFTLNDSAGSGGASSTAQADGYLTPTGTTPTSNGANLDLFYFYNGLRTVSVSHADNVGNAGSGSCTLVMRATSESLGNNLTRAVSEGLVPASVAAILEPPLTLAESLHNQGLHGQEVQQLQSFRSLLNANAAQIEPNTAARFSAWTQGLINREKPGCGLGVEIAPVLVALGALRRRLARARSARARTA